MIVGYPPPSVGHGTPTRYNQGCRCEDCTFAKALASHKYKRENPDLIAVHNQRRRLREAEAFTALELGELRERFEGLCAYGVLYDVHAPRPGPEVGHVLPLSRGGNNTIENILPICRECNRGVGGQHSKTLEEWLPEVWS